MSNKNLYLEAGLGLAGIDDEGNDLYIGTDSQWRKYEELSKLPDDYDDPALMDDDSPIEPYERDMDEADNIPNNRDGE